MAIFHFHVNIVKRSKGQSAIKKVSYDSASKLMDERTKKIFDYTKKGNGVAFSEILAPINSPDWIYDRGKLWNVVENFEKRENSQLARTIEVALPKELNLEQQKNLLREYLKTNFTKIGLIADYSIHVDNPNNPHAHILLTMRSIKNGHFNESKNREINKKTVLNEWRMNWGNLINRYLEKFGVNEKIDYRSYKEIGTNKLPTRHLGPHISNLLKKGVITQRVRDNKLIKRYNEKNGNEKNIDATLIFFKADESYIGFQKSETSELFEANLKQLRTV
jgi:ATP-dependent exoDNAse (exonuclease V) alpha subunit